MLNKLKNSTVQVVYCNQANIVFFLLIDSKVYRLNWNQKIFFNILTSIGIYMYIYKFPEGALSSIQVSKYDQNTKKS